MARRRKKVVKRSFAKGVAVAAVKGAGSAALGAAVGTTEVLAGETPATVAKVGMGVAGVLSEMYVDRESHPVIASVGDSMLHGPSFSSGEKYAKHGVRSLLDKNREKRRAEDLATLREDLAAEFPDEEETAQHKTNGAAGVAIPVVEPRERRAEAHPPVQE